jgi:hypothetical protein
LSEVEAFMAQVADYRAKGSATGPLVFFPFRLSAASGGGAGT